MQISSSASTSSEMTMMIGSRIVCGTRSGRRGSRRRRLDRDALVDRLPDDLGQGQRREHHGRHGGHGSRRESPTLRKLDCMSLTACSAAQLQPLD